jgi:hypothetical protein
MDLTSILPAVIGFFVVAGLAIAMAVAAFVVLATDSRRRPANKVVSMSSAHPGVTATTRRAA